MLYFILIIILSLILAFLQFKNSYSTNEGYSNYILAGSQGEYPSAQTDVLLQDTYPVIGKNSLSNNNSADIWRNYPINTVGSYDQVTNNIRVPSNPDEGTCMPASMCGALYYDKQVNGNHVDVLPPVNTECGTRIGYFTTNENLLPFRTNMGNILY
jgi:hypothetical protein